MVAVRVDEKGRVTVPKEVREALGVRPGDTMFWEIVGSEVRWMKAQNPFDALAENAEKEYRAGRTKNLRTLAREQGIDLSAE